MAAKLPKLFRGAGRNALDLPVAGLSALAAAFAAFAIPQDVLSRAVVATGLPRILSAAQPPLGLTARVALAVGGAAIVFGIVLLALRLLDRSGSRTEAADESQSGPRVRRRDGHPDAPMPRPISAARDLGEPAPPHAPRAEVPLWLDEAEPTPPAFGAAPEPEFEPEPFFAPEAEVEPEAEAEPEIWRAPEPVVFPEPVAEFAPEPEPEAQPEPAPVLEVEPEPESEFVPAPEPEPVAVAEAAEAPAPAPRAEMPTSIADLMERLEQGLARRKMIEPAPLPAQLTESLAEAPQAFPEAPQAPEPAEAADDRLQSAIASLQRLAARSA